jgi:hypothetical protein
MTWGGHVEHLGEDIWRVFVGNHKGKKLLVELDVEGSIMLKWSLKNHCFYSNSCTYTHFKTLIYINT